MLIIFSLGRVSLPASTSHGPIRGTSGQPPAELHSLSRSDPNPCVVLPTPNPCVFLQANPCLCTNPPPECPLQEMPHPDLPSSGVVLQSNRGTGMCLPVLATVTVWTSHPAPLLASFCIQTLSRVLTLTSDRLATCGSVSDNSHGSMTESWRHEPDVQEQV